MQLDFEKPDFMKNLFPGYTGIPILAPIKITGNFPHNFSVTEIHREFYSHINMHSITVIHDSVFLNEFFLVTALLARLPNTSTSGLLSV